MCEPQALSEEVRGVLLTADLHLCLAKKEPARLVRNNQLVMLEADLYRLGTRGHRLWGFRDMLMVWANPPVFSTSPKLVKNDNMHINQPPPPPLFQVGLR